MLINTYLDEKGVLIGALSTSQRLALKETQAFPSSLSKAIICEEVHFSIFIFKDSLQQLPVWTVSYLEGEMVSQKPSMSPILLWVCKPWLSLPKKLPCQQQLMATHIMDYHMVSCGSIDSGLQHDFQRLITDINLVPSGKITVINMGSFGSRDHRHQHGISFQQHGLRHDLQRSGTSTWIAMDTGMAFIITLIIKGRSGTGL